MTKVRVFHTLEPEYRDKWVVDSRDEGMKPYDTKKQAVKEGRRLAKKYRSSTLKILCKDGSVDKTHRYN